MQNSDSIKRLLTLATVVACCLFATWQVWPKVTNWNQEQLADQLGAQIKAASDDKVRIPLRQLAALGIAAVPPLVEASASERTAVAEQARQIINEKFDSWQLQASTNRRFDIATPITTLAKALAANVDRYGPRGQRWAESLTLRMIVLAEQVSATKAKILLEDCSYVLNVIPASGPRLRSVQNNRPVRSSGYRPPSAPGIPLDTFAVPSETVIAPARQAPPNLEQRATVFPATPGAVLPNPQTATPNSLNWSPDWGEETARIPNAKPLPPIQVQPITPPTPPVARQPKNSGSLFVDIPSPAEMNQQLKRLRQKTSPELVRLLPQNNLYEAGPIRAVLRERGVTEEELLLTEQFSSTHVSDRLKLIEKLSALPAATARRWLHWLLEDKSPEVRLRALSAIATTSDPRLFEVARDVAVNDKDPRVANLASEIMKQAR